jgi:two-component system, NarL family, invasion response regulator UvrY
VNLAVIRVLLVDDHAIVRAGFKRLLEQQPEMRVVAEAPDAEQAYSLFIDHRPDVVVMDVSMPGVSGLEAIRRMIGREPSARILVFSMHEHAPLAERAIQLGARGYVTKSESPDTLVSAIASVAAGKLYLSPEIAKAIAILKLTGGADPVKELNAREFEIFRLFAGGRPIVDIAQMLNLSRKTVANYHTLVKQKLGITSDVELVLLAVRLNIL